MLGITHAALQQTPGTQALRRVVRQFLATSGTMVRIGVDGRICPHGILARTSPIVVFGAGLLQPKTFWTLDADGYEDDSANSQQH
jgi:hypothetical protein